jgi:hypothetical protein
LAQSGPTAVRYRTPPDQFGCKHIVPRLNTSFEDAIEPETAIDLRNITAVVMSIKMDQAACRPRRGQAFAIEAEGWPSEDDASASVIGLQLWVMRFGPEETAGLHAVKPACGGNRQAL